MRAAESSALALGLEVPTPAIVGVAAGTILDPANRDRLRDGGIVVWLRADADALTARASGAAHRPWIDTGGGSWMQDATTERGPLYESVADIVIDTTSGSPDAVAADLLERLLAFEACR